MSIIFPSIGISSKRSPFENVERYLCADYHRRGRRYICQCLESPQTYRLNNGVIHVIDEMMAARINLYEYIKQLPDEYSIYRDSIMAYSVELFDESKSTPIGVDKTGNTIYDSVFVVYNPLFDTVEINSEFKQFTCFIPDNNVMKDCFTK